METTSQAQQGNTGQGAWAGGGQDLYFGFPEVSNSLRVCDIRLGGTLSNLSVSFFLNLGGH